MANNNRLKSLLTNTKEESQGPQEVNMNMKMTPAANIKVIWVWWGWWNAVNDMVASWFDGVEFIAINTDSQDLFISRADTKIAIWKAVTWWLGAWANPEVWKKAAEESSEEIKKALEGADMVFITAGMWGWTGTGAAPVVAEIAKWLWILTIWVVTKPFSFEWQARMRKAIEWHKNLQEKVDALITIPNDRVLSIIDKKTPITETFAIVDQVLSEWVKWVADLITHVWLISVDFADIQSIMRNAGSAMMGIGFGSGENRAVDAARSAIESPLLELSIAWAKWVLFSITGWTDLSMFEIDEAAKIITESVDIDANIIFGTTVNEEYTWELKITVIATGFNEESNESYKSWSMDTRSSFTNVGKAPTPTPARKIVEEVQQRAPTMKPKEDPMDDLDIPPFFRNKL